MALELGPEYSSYEVDTSSFCKRDWDIIEAALTERIAVMEVVIDATLLGMSESQKAILEKEIEDMKTILNVIGSDSEVEEESEDD